VTIRLRSGEELHWACESMLASPARRLTREQHLAKFRRCWDFAEGTLPDGAREALIAAVDDLEMVADARELAALVRVP